MRLGMVFDCFFGDYVDNIDGREYEWVLLLLRGMTACLLVSL